jgi:hypothetical protein
MKASASSSGIAKSSDSFTGLTLPRSVPNFGFGLIAATTWSWTLAAPGDDDLFA